LILLFELYKVLHLTKFKKNNLGFEVRLYQDLSFSGMFNLKKSLIFANFGGKLMNILS